MFKFLLISILGLMSLFTFAGEVHLVTSLKLKENNIRYLERNFANAFKNSQLKTVIHHEADPETLYKIMTSDETEAVIWISHAAGDHHLQAGLKGTNIIADFYGNDVKKFFTLIPKNLRFLGIVGCQAKGIVDGFRERGNYASAPSLEIMSFEKKVRMYPSFQKVLKEAKKVLAKNFVPHSNEETIPLKISRSHLGDLPSLQPGWVEMGDKVLGIFSLNEMEPVSNLNISKAFWESTGEEVTKRNIKFMRLHSATTTDESTGVLNLELDPSLGQWKLFANRDRKPIGGKDQQLYIFKQ